MQQYLLGIRDFPPATREELERLSRTYAMRRSRLWVTLPTGVRLVPPPSERGMLIGEYHAQYCHLGRDRLLSLLEDDCWWPGMSQDVAAHCQRCLACQLQGAVFHRSVSLGGHLSAAGPR